MKPQKAVIGKLESGIDVAERINSVRGPLEG